MKRNLKIILCLIGIITSLGIILGTIFYANKNLKFTNITFSKEMKEENKEEKSVEPSDSGQTAEGLAPDESVTTKIIDENNLDETVSSSDKIISNDDNQIMDNNGVVTIMEKTTTADLLTFESGTGNVELTKTQKLLIGCGSVLFTISLLYLILSKFCSKIVFINKDKIIIFILLTTVISEILTYGIICFTNNF